MKLQQWIFAVCSLLLIGFAHWYLFSGIQKSAGSLAGLSPRRSQTSISQLNRNHSQHTARHESSHGIRQFRFNVFFQVVAHSGGLFPH